MVRNLLQPNKYGISDPKHHTNRKPSKPTMFQQVNAIEDIETSLVMRNAAIETLFQDLARAKTPAHKKFIESQLRAFGEGDYTPADEGEAPKGAIW